jgi:hypothetical protein
MTHSIDSSQSLAQLVIVLLHPFEWQFYDYVRRLLSQPFHCLDSIRPSLQLASSSIPCTVAWAKTVLSPSSPIVSFRPLLPPQSARVVDERRYVRWTQATPFRVHDSLAVVLAYRPRCDEPVFDN